MIRNFARSSPHPPSRAARMGARTSGDRAFVLFLALGVLAVVYLLAIAATSSAFSARNVVRMQDEREQMASVRRTLETLAAGKLADEGTIQLGPWEVTWRTLPLQDSEFARAGAKGELRVVQAVTRRAGAEPARVFIQQILFTRSRNAPWTVAAWKQIGGRSSESVIP